MRKLLYLLLFAVLISCSGNTNDTGLGLNVYQLGESNWTLNQENTLKKQEFSLIFSFPNVPKKADTNFTIYYWATTDKSMLSTFKKAKKLEDLKIESGGINIDGNNNDECIVIDMEGYKGLLIDKKGSKREISHSFTNIDRVGSRIDCWYKISQFYDCETNDYVPIEKLKNDQLFMYFSVRNNSTSKEIEGRFVELYFE